MPEPTSPAQRETLKRLKEEMEQTKASYDSATEAYDQAKKKYNDPSAQVLAHATRRHDFTLESYRCALLRFSAFVMSGVAPTNIQSPSTQT